jgi:hypothetical protein
VSRPKGSRTVWVRITYDTIGELAGGIAGDTVRQYAQRCQFNPRDLDSALAWVNARRTAKGLPLIGLPTKVGEAVPDDDSEEVRRETPFNPPTRTGLYYDLLTGSYRWGI